MNLEAENFYFKASPYTEFAFKDEDFEDLFNLIFFYRKIDWFCPACGKETTFKGEPNFEKKKVDNNLYESTLISFSEFSKYFSISYFHNKQFELKFKCSRDEYLHSVKFITRVDSDKIYKIGQFPSYGDLSDHKTKKFNKVLTKEKFAEFNRAIGLFSYGIGIGSIVYLRRIFEDLIYSAFNSHAKDIGQDVDLKNFSRLKMDEKIELLKPFLPAFLVEHKNIYGILSQGVHKLNENECLSIFPTIRCGIELILEEKILQYEREEKIRQFKIDISNRNKC
jgi:hypothetical protein